MPDNPSPVPELAKPIEVYVVQPYRHRWWLHIVLLLLTFITTSMVGASLEYKFLNDLPILADTPDTLPLFPLSWILHEPRNLLMGIPFSLALMGILLAHEMGHYVYCVKYGVQATLPYFIPAPTLIGTLGAFIRIRSRIYSRAALFDIGIAGPIAGFVVAVPLLLGSLLLSKPIMTPHPEEVAFGFPLIFHLAHGIIAVFGGDGTALGQMRLHPTAVAAWAGMLATSLNLLPGGQLDGGHISYALAPYRHRILSRLTVLVLLVLAFFFSVTWTVWAVMLMVLGSRHPAVPVWPEIPESRRKLGWVALAMLVLTFIPVPFEGSLLDVLLELFQYLRGGVS